MRSRRGSWQALAACTAMLLAAACDDSAGGNGQRGVFAGSAGAGAPGADPNGAGAPALGGAGSSPLDAAAAANDAASGAVEPPLADDLRAVHVVLERDGELVVARVVPAEGYAGRIADPLPVDPGDVEDAPVLWARDEGPRLVIDLGAAGVYASEGGAWTRLDDGLPVGSNQTRWLAVTPAVDRVLLEQSAVDPNMFQWRYDGGLYALDGRRLFESGMPDSMRRVQLGPLSADGSLFATVETALDGFGWTYVRRTSDATESARLPFTQGVVAVFDGSVIVGSPDAPSWYSHDGKLLSAADLAPLVQGSWRSFRIGRDEHAVIARPPGTQPPPDPLEPVRLYRLQAGGPGASYLLPPGMAGESVLATTDERVVGLVTSPREARAYVVADAEARVIATFAAAASVVEERAGLEGVDEWERRPLARAWHASARRFAVALEVAHTYFRGEYGVKAAVTEELWVVGESGARVERLAQIPADDAGAAVRQRAFTADGAHYVWAQGQDVHAVSLDDFARVELAGGP